MRLTQIVEALLFASDSPLTAADLARVDERLDGDSVVAVIDELRSEYDAQERSFTVAELAGGYQLLTRPEFDVVLDRYQTVPQSAKLSVPALEVLAIIAYRQPLGRAEVEEIRGIQSAAVLKTLQDRDLIEPVGRGEGLGRPMLYGTTSKLLEHFGFRSLEDLPRPDDLPVVLRAALAPEGDVPFGLPDDPTEPSPLSDEAEAEAEDLRLRVHPARDQIDPEATGERAVEVAATAIAASLDASVEEGEGDGTEPSGDDVASETALDGEALAISDGVSGDDSISGFADDGEADPDADDSDDDAEVERDAAAGVEAGSSPRD
jgi:segregation and condensation protein B